MPLVTLLNRIGALNPGESSEIFNRASAAMSLTLAQHFSLDHLPSNGVKGDISRTIHSIIPVPVSRYLSSLCRMSSDQAREVGLPVAFTVTDFPAMNYVDIGSTYKDLPIEWFSGPGGFVAVQNDFIVRLLFLPQSPL